MNGFGQDPNYMYSFRQAGYNPRQSTIDAMSGGQDALRSLRESLAYGQAGMEGKQRMERVVSMGLPANSDINKIHRLGYDPEMRRPIYAAPRPQPFGTFGSIGMNNDEQPVSLPRTPTMPSGGPQPAQGTTPAPIVPEIKKTELGTSGGAIAFTPFGRMAEFNFPSLAGSLTGFGGIPRFPFAKQQSPFENY